MQDRPQGRLLYRDMVPPDAKADALVDGFMARGAVEAKREEVAEARHHLPPGQRHRALEVAEEAAAREDETPPSHGVFAFGDGFDEDGEPLVVDVDDDDEVFDPAVGGDPELPVIRPDVDMRRRIKTTAKRVKRRPERRHAGRGAVRHTLRTRSRGAVPRPKAHARRRSSVSRDDGDDDGPGDDGPGESPAPVGASLEVIAHHDRQHPCRGASVIERVCPCGRALAIICDRCGEPVFVAIAPDGPPCVHALELMGPA